MHLRHRHRHAAGNAGDREQRLQRVRLEPERAAHVRHDSRRSVLDRSRAPHHQDQRDHRDDAEDADADMRRAPAVADDEMLHDRRPDGARKIVAAGCNADRDATPLLEPVRHVGDDRTERRRRADADHHMGGVEHPDVRRIAGADVADRKQHRAEDRREDDAVTIRKPAHDDAAEREADHRHRVGERGGVAQDAEVGLHRRQRDHVRPHADAADGAEHQRDEQAYPGVSGVDPAEVGAGRLCNRDHKTRR